MDALQRHKTALTAVILVTVSLVLMFLSGRVVPGRRGGAVADAMNRTIGFVQSGVSRVLGTISKGFDSYTGLLSVQEENQKLRKQLKNMRPFLTSYMRLQRENERLRRLIGYRSKHPRLITLAAHVVARSLNAYFHVVRLQIAVTPDAKIPPRAAVLSPDGVVGRILHSFGQYADCLLVSDRRSRIPAYAPGKQVQGVVIGKGAYIKYQAVFRTLTSSKRLSDGTLIVTSGRDGTFPEGMEIGRITDSKHCQQSGLYMDYPVALSNDIDALQDVMIVLGVRGQAK